VCPRFAKFLRLGFFASSMAPGVWGVSSPLFLTFAFPLARRANNVTWGQLDPPTSFEGPTTSEMVLSTENLPAGNDLSPSLPFLSEKKTGSFRKPSPISLYLNSALAKACAFRRPELPFIPPFRNLNLARAAGSLSLPRGSALISL